MNRTIEAFDAFLRGKQVFFCGLGLSHRELVSQYLKKGALVHVCDKRVREQLTEEELAYEARGVRFHLGSDYLKGLEQARVGDIVFRTPGMRFHLPELQAARRRGASVTSEMEVFFRLCPCRIIAVTGSDGKTTTTTLIAEMLRAAGYRVHLGGNIGRPLLPVVDTIRPEDFAVVELSSFQLISMRQSPEIAVVTNLSENHLDIHASMEEYIDAKRNIFLHQDAFSKTVLNLDNEITAGFAPEIRGRLLWFSRKSEPENGVFLRGDRIFYSENGEEQELLHRSEIRLLGIHNAENLMAATAAVRDLVTPDIIRKTAREFAGVEHRMEFVREFKGVFYYNDSIATSPARTIAGLRAYPGKVILLAGGYDKHLDYTPLAGDIIEHVKLLILTGATADKIEAAVRSHPDYETKGPEILRAADLEEAVKLAALHGKPGDLVTLSPASASFDRYPNFEVRGRHFKDLVAALQ